MTRRQRRWVSGLAAIALTAGAAGFGGHSAAPAREDSRSAMQIYKDALAATSAAKSLHYAGTVNSSGSNVSLSVSITPGRSGGFITEKGGTLQMVVTATEVYISATTASWTKLTGSAAEGQLLGGRWLKVPVTNQDFSGFVDFTKVSKLLQDNNPGVLTKGKVTTYAGQKVIPITSTKGGTIDVADSGPPYILRLVKASNVGGSGTGQIVFSQYGHAHAPSIPRKALDFQALANASS